MTRDRVRQLLDGLARPMPTGPLERAGEVARTLFFECELDPAGTDTAAAVRLTALIILRQLSAMAAAGQQIDCDLLAAIVAGHARVFAELTGADDQLTEELLAHDDNHC